MNIWIVSTGDEILAGELVDSNTAWLSARLADAGTPPAQHRSIPDDQVAIQATIRAASREADAAVFCGGLGPTEDDLSADAAAACLGAPVVLDQPSLDRARRLLEERGIRFTENNTKQAAVPEGARVITNPAGLAPGFAFELGRCRFWFLPGVPREFKALCEQSVLPELTDLLASEGIRGFRTAVLKMAAVPESHLAKAVDEIRSQHPQVRFGYRAHYPEVWLKIRMPHNAPLAETADAIASHLVATFGPKIIGRDDDELETVVIAMLRERGLTLSTAESCTGGLVGGLLTAVPGSSEAYMGGGVTYSDELKMRLLGVPAELLERHGAVSPECAVAMAEGARRSFDTDLAVSVTGIAGPGGGSAEKPVGTVHFALAGPEGTRHKLRTFRPPRDTIRRTAAWTALNMVRLHLLSGS